MRIKEFFQSNKLKKAEWLIFLIGSFTLLVTLLLLGVYVIFLNPLFIRSFALKFDAQTTLQISTADLKAVINNITLYFAFLKRSLQSIVTMNGTPTNFYTADELSHMHDVLGIFKVFLPVFIISFLMTTFMVVYTLFNFKERKTRKRLGVSLLIPPITFLIALIPILISVIVDFDATFTTFHEIFFPQGNWQFDNNSYMLMLLPEELFLSGALWIGSLWVLAILLQITSGILLLSVKSRHNKKDQPLIVDNIVSEV